MAEDMTELRAKWHRYGELLTEPEGEGSMLGRCYMIATSGVTDIAALFVELDRLEKIETKARGLVRTAHPSDVGDHEVVRSWFDSLKAALDA